MLTNQKVLGSSFFLCGLLQLSSLIGMIPMDFTIIAAITFLYYGVITVFVNFNRGIRSLIFIGTVIFQLGILLIISDSYNLMEKDHFFLTAFTFMGGAGFLLLFLENIKQFPLLVVGVLLIITSVFSQSITAMLGRFSLMANIGLVMMGYWSLFLIFFGAAILASRSKT